MVNRQRARIGMALGLAVAAAGLATLEACSTILGIGELPIDAGGPDVTTDGGKPDHANDAGACVPACSGKTPYCLDHTCVACKPSSVGCNAAGAPQQCNPGGTWVPSPACGASTPFCLAGSCVQCLPSKEPPKCLPEGGLQTCSEAGLYEVTACPCASDRCQAWPTGKMGDCHFDSGTTTRYDPGVVLDCKSLEVDNGATVLFEGSPDGGSLDAAATWTVIGIVENAVIDGTIVSRLDSLGHDMTVEAQVPSGDAGLGEMLTYDYVQAEGGAGGSAGWMCAGNFAEGGLPSAGNGGGGGGGGIYFANTSLAVGATSCGSSCGTTTSGGAGQSAGPWSGGSGGNCPSIPADGGSGATVFGALGANGAANGTVAAGGGGGSRGKHGGLVYLRVVGALSGVGRVDLSGQPGGPGGTGQLVQNVSVPFLCTSLPGYFNETGAGSGGGGAGGSGGAFVLRYQGDAGAFLARVNVAGGPGGMQPYPGGNIDHKPGANGAPGVIDAGPIPP